MNTTTTITGTEPRSHRRLRPLSPRGQRLLRELLRANLDAAAACWQGLRYAQDPEDAALVGAWASARWRAARELAWMLEAHGLEAPARGTLRAALERLRFRLWAPALRGDPVLVLLAIDEQVQRADDALRALRPEARDELAARLGRLAATLEREREQLAARLGRVLDGEPAAVG
ncbi:MAG: hypothetical protein AB7N76_25670 [Planctomycetota bacterium]